jgi:transposase
LNTAEIAERCHFPVEYVGKIRKRYRDEGIERIVQRRYKPVGKSRRSSAKGKPPKRYSIVLKPGEKDRLLAIAAGTGVPAGEPANRLYLPRKIRYAEILLKLAEKDEADRTGGCGQEILSHKAIAERYGCSVVLVNRLHRLYAEEGPDRILGSLKDEPAGPPEPAEQQPEPEPAVPGPEPSGDILAALTGITATGKPPAIVLKPEEKEWLEALVGADNSKAAVSRRTMRVLALLGLGKLSRYKEIARILHCRAEFVSKVYRDYTEQGLEWAVYHRYKPAAKSAGRVAGYRTLNQAIHQVELKGGERELLETVLKEGLEAHPAWKLRRAAVVLKLAEKVDLGGGEARWYTEQNIAEQCGCSKVLVHKVRGQYMKEGLDGVLGGGPSVSFRA